MIALFEQFFAASGVRIGIQLAHPVDGQINSGGVGVGVGVRRPSDGAMTVLGRTRALTSKPKIIKRSGRTMYLSQGCGSGLLALDIKFNLPQPGF